ncbi:UNVERIFIED_CONTAM: Pentatricopeptide repeat-containing protein, chloroplastic [Sesamum radiatum]|uniref:Pentatricopeptide repeat-containing protein, chloroplastic n=1 Tax=Sesamum radiatum TaxID=300843 RepID=A0AAW2REC4_SESRA
MLSLAEPTKPFPPPLNRRTQTRNQHRPQLSNGNNGGNTLAVSERRLDLEKLKEVEARERKEETNRKISSRKAISIILRREATKAVIEK